MIVNTRLENDATAKHVTLTRAVAPLSSRKGWESLSRTPLPHANGLGRGPAIQMQSTVMHLRIDNLMHALRVNGFRKRVVHVVDIDASDDRFVILGEIAGDLITHDGMRVGMGRPEQG